MIKDVLGNLTSMTAKATGRLLNGSQAVAAAYTYDGYGNILLNREVSINRLNSPQRHTMREQDSRTMVIRSIGQLWENGRLGIPSGRREGTIFMNLWAGIRLVGLTRMACVGKVSIPTKLY